MTPNKIFSNYLWEDWIEMVIGSLNIEQKIIDRTEWKLNWATKVRVRKGYFCNWLTKNWPTMTSSPHWTTTKYWTPPPFCSSYLNFRKNLPPLTCLLWNLGSSPFTKVRGRGRGVERVGETMLWAAAFVYFNRET